jgi:hypothetical protein
MRNGAIVSKSRRRARASRHSASLALEVRAYTLRCNVRFEAA